MKMKSLVIPSIILSIPLIFFSMQTLHENHEGIIEYITIVPDKVLKENFGSSVFTMEQIRDLVNKKNRLYFDRHASLWHESGEAHIEGKYQPYSHFFKTTEVIIYRDLNSNLNIETYQNPKSQTIDFYRKNQLEKSKWEITGKKEIILNYECIEAIKKNKFGEITVKAFYTPEIPIDVGPYEYNGLDGAILKVYEIEDRDNITTIEAYRIDLKKLDNDLIKCPDTTNVPTHKTYLKSISHSHK